jgi:hypothetical protein
MKKYIKDVAPKYAVNKISEKKYVITKYQRLA